MKVIGLTGGIASGKSTAARLLVELGASVIDADILARDAVGPGSEALTAIVETFGNQILRADGMLDRAELGRQVFAAPEARKTLEGIIHPEVRRLARLKLQAFKESGVQLAFYMAPLLIEAGAATFCDEIWVVDLDEATQLQRVMTRDNLSSDEARQRMAAQMPLAEKAARGDVLIDNRGSIKELTARLAKLWEEELSGAVRSRNAGVRYRDSGKSGEVIETT